MGVHVKLCLFSYLIPSNTLTQLCVICNIINYVSAKHMYVSQLACCVTKSFSFRLN